MVKPEEEIVNIVNPCDVLHGRGKSVHCHAGNREYRELVKAKAHEYQMQSSMEKDDTALEVIRSIEDRGGRFLRRTGKEGSPGWAKCPYSIVRTKVKQALRDMTKIKSTSPAGTKRKGIGPQSEYSHAQQEPVVDIGSVDEGDGERQGVREMMNGIPVVNGSRGLQESFVGQRWTDLADDQSSWIRDMLRRPIPQSISDGNPSTQTASVVGANYPNWLSILAAQRQLPTMVNSSQSLSSILPGSSNILGSVGVNGSRLDGILRDAVLLQNYSMLLRQQQHIRPTQEEPSVLTTRDREIELLRGFL